VLDEAPDGVGLPERRARSAATPPRQGRRQPLTQGWRRRPVRRRRASHQGRSGNGSVSQEPARCWLAQELLSWPTQPTAGHSPSNGSDRRLSQTASFQSGPALRTVLAQGWGIPSGEPTARPAETGTTDSPNKRSHGPSTGLKSSTRGSLAKGGRSANSYIHPLGRALRESESLPNRSMAAIDARSEGQANQPSGVHTDTPAANRPCLARHGRSTTRGPTTSSAW